MASYISVPRDLTRVKSKIIFNLTKRQVICFSLAAMVGVPAFFLFKSFMPISGATLLMMAVVFPFFFFAMYEKNGQPLEVVLKHVIDSKFRRPKLRPYRTDNYYSALMRQNEVDEEVFEIVFLSKEPVCPEGKPQRCESTKEPEQAGKKRNKEDSGQGQEG